MHLVFTLICIFIAYFQLSQTNAAGIDFSTRKHSVKSIPFLDTKDSKPSMPVYTGYLPTLSKHRFLFYMLVSPETDADKKPLILWMNGGPGCSSMIAALEEIGPFQLESDKLVKEKGSSSWHHIANILFIDQPAGAGLSPVVGQRDRGDTSNAVKSSHEAMIDVAEALKAFILEYPEFKNRDFYLAGESYSGKFIPNLNHILQNHQVKVDLQLRGVILGNAILVPSIQYATIVNHAAAFGIISYQHKVKMNQLFEQCMVDVKKKDIASQHELSCWPMVRDTLSHAGNLNPYDVRTTRDALASHKNIEHYFKHINNNQQFLDDWGIQKFDFKTPGQYYNFHRCNQHITKLFHTEVHEDLPADVMSSLLSSTQTKPPFNVLFYSGQFDIRVDTLGTQELLRIYPWAHREEFINKNPAVFKKDEKNLGGHFQMGGNVIFMSIYGASHLTAEYRQQVTKEMIARFISKGHLCPGNQPECSKDLTPECPNDCSGNGECQPDKTCKCNKEFLSKDCSIGKRSYTGIDSYTSQKGRIVGRETVIYQYELDADAYRYVDIMVQLKRTSISGSPFLFLRVHPPSEKIEIKTMRENLRLAMEKSRNGIDWSSLGFQHYNLSHHQEKVMNILHEPLKRFEKNLVTLFVYNSDDTTTDFSLIVQFSPSAKPFYLAWLLFSVSIVCLLIIAAEIFFMVKRLRDRKKSRSSRPEHRYSNLGESSDIQLETLVEKEEEATYI